MWSSLEQQFRTSLQARIHDLYGLDIDPPVLLPPQRSMGDLASPVALGLARELKNSPRDIANKIAEDLRLPEDADRLSVEGAGYLNLFLNRAAIAEQTPRCNLVGVAPDRRKIIVEHTNINPNKAAHIGHLRNAVLGDILARLLRGVGHDVEVQNYIDDTGVQVADVVVGFTDIEGASRDDVAALPDPFDYLCWDLYAKVGAWYEEDPERRPLRQQTLHQLESGEGDRARMGQMVAERIVGRHLATMQRLDISYDLLTRESDILALDFFSRAFEQLKDSGAVRFEDEGKNAGCWVMPLTESEEFRGLEDPDKVIVRSDGTITYVGKDIAYQLWKFGLLGLDFGYRYWDNENIWRTDHGSEQPEAATPKFGAGDHAINVIDARQSYLQKIVRAGLEALGHEDEAKESFHFAYEMVSLSSATAAALGVGNDGGSVEMSGRKGIGVKADDLIDQLIEKSATEIQQRNPEVEESDRQTLATQIAVAALRMFMAKATTTRVIAFDLDEALAFEGETGPYLQYSAVRARNIRSKLEAAGIETDVAAPVANALWRDHDDLWDLVVATARTPQVIAEATTPPYEISLVARHGFDLAQKFNAAYHRHPVLHEEDEELRRLRLQTFACFERGIETVCGLLGIRIPARM